jgi:hypothetical protein
MRNTLLVLCALGLLVAVPSFAFSDELNVAHRWAVGLQSNAIDFGLNPTVEYWTSENFGVSASITGLIGWVGLGVRGTYLWNTPVHIFPIPARPYAGAGVGFLDFPFVTGHAAFYGENIEAFGGLLQPINDRWSVRAELNAGWQFVSWPGDYHRGFYSPVSLGLGIFYHIPAR